MTILPVTIPKPPTNDPLTEREIIERRIARERRNAGRRRRIGLYRRLRRLISGQRARPRVEIHLPKGQC
ncbi:hypothetical protein [Pseudoroseicyclus tamaricis]|uniref:Uncharacterized protein n=1 Tax=Pseudoroseicyclus tamaricis TaxID=2705421 RepID=A0A6B2JRJ6_9RHOB|nr:hypothetical protein [Pseudoroseicyclus tamaricis]NDV00808.1 hypothetical protein [Pseudoroseicyclus tamaricis]